MTASRISVGEWAEHWISTQVQLKPSTRQGYESIVRTRVVPKWGRVSLGARTHAGVQTWISEESKRASTGTVRSYHRVLSMMLKYAIRDGRLSRNVADGIRLPRIRKAKHGYLTHAQVHEFAQRCAPDGDVVMFLAYNGAQIG